MGVKRNDLSSLSVRSVIDHNVIAIAGIKQLNGDNYAGLCRNNGSSRGAREIYAAVIASV